MANNVKENILVIDDNRDILEFLSGILGTDYVLITAESGEAGLKILDDKLIHLIICDIMMPGIDGFELCEQIKSKVDYCHIPIILLTSKNTFQAQITGLEVGADAYVKKPFSPKFLKLQIDNLLKNRVKIKTHFSGSPFEDIRIIAHSRTDERFLEQLDEYIRKNLRDPAIDIEKMAAHFHLSRPTFYRKIKSLSTLSPKELIDLTRLKQSVELIARDEFTFYEIAKKVGYSSQTVFGRNFSKHFKMSPSEYLATLRKKSEIK